MNTAERTWPYSIEKICYAINMGVGLPIVGFDTDHCIFHMAGTGCDVTVRLYYQDDCTTTVVLESVPRIYHHRINPYIPNMPVNNFDAIAISNNVHNILDRINDNLNSMEKYREPTEGGYYEGVYYEGGGYEGGYYAEEYNYEEDDEDYFDDDYYHNNNDDEQFY